MKYVLFSYISITLICSPFDINANVFRDSSKVKQIEIISKSFRMSSKPLATMNVNSLLLHRKFTDYKTTLSYYRILNNEDSKELEGKLSPILRNDTISGIYDDDMDLTFLLVITYDERKTPVYIGIEKIGRMFINGKRYKVDKIIMELSLKYIKEKKLRKEIQTAMKKW